MGLIQFLRLSGGTSIGLSPSILGGGGSILTVPILVYFLGQDVHSATEASLAIVGFSASIGAVAHNHRKKVRTKSGLIFSAVSMLGAIPGPWLNRLSPVKRFCCFSEAG